MRARLAHGTGEIGRAERPRGVAPYCSAGGFDEMLRVGLQRIAKLVVRRDEEPGVPAGLGQRAAGSLRQRVGIGPEMEPVRGAEFSCQVARGRSVAQIDRFLLPRDFLDGEAGRGRATVHQHIDSALDPFPGFGTGYVGLVLNVGLHDLDGPAKQFATEILASKFHGDPGARAADVPVRSADIAQQADPHGCGGGPGGQQARPGKDRGSAEHAATCDCCCSCHCLLRSLIRGI